MISTIRSMNKHQKNAIVMVAVFVACAAFIVGFASSALIKYEQAQDEKYRDKVNFCIDRMKYDVVLSYWRQKYCPKVRLDAVDPISGRPVAGIVEER